MKVELGVRGVVKEFKCGFGGLCRFGLALVGRVIELRFGV